MKQFLLWCVVFFGLYGVLSSAYHLHLTSHPRRVLVAVDTSFPMQAVWSQVPDTSPLSRCSAIPLFSLITDKARIHPWQSRLEFGHLQPYAPAPWLRCWTDTGILRWLWRIRYTW